VLLFVSVALWASLEEDCVWGECCAEECAGGERAVVWTLAGWAAWRGLSFLLVGELVVVRTVIAALVVSEIWGCGYLSWVVDLGVSEVRESWYFGVFGLFVVMNIFVPALAMCGI